ncbi:MAG: macro domain-containing protein [Chitinophagales bacterium]
MNIVLVDRNIPMTKAWAEAFEGNSLNLTIFTGSIFDVECDAMVSPANSFGFMDGGLDLFLSRYLGWHVQARLQALIRQKHQGELLVGQAEIVATDHPKTPYLISAPTMRVPAVVKNTMNAYLAFRAVLLLVKYGEFEDGSFIKNAVKTIAITGLGTGVGKMPYHTCAKQMKAAYDEVVLEKGAFPRSWDEAQRQQIWLSY